MDFMKAKVKFIEGFKDGNILGGRVFQPGQIVVLDEQDVKHIQVSGGLIDVLEQMIPNPKKSAAVESVEESENEGTVAPPKPARGSGKSVK